MNRREFIAASAVAAVALAQPENGGPVPLDEYSRQNPGEPPADWGDVVATNADDLVINAGDLTGMSILVPDAVLHLALFTS